MKNGFAEIIHQNRGGTRRIKNIPIRNLLEGFVESGIVIAILLAIPFVPTLKLMLVCIFLLGIMIVNIVGFRNRSWTEVLVLWIRFRRSKKTLKLRSPMENGKSRINPSKEKSQFIQKAEEYLDDYNLEQGNDLKRSIIRGAKSYIGIVLDSFRR